MDGKKEDANPFSFKKFMTSSDSQKTKTLEVVDDDDIFKAPDRRQEASKKLIISDEDANQRKPKKKGKGENPFSFKKFLSGSSKKGPTDTTVKTGEQNPVFENVDNSLPDFVQDHYYSDTHEAAAKGITKSHSSDSFEIPLDLPHLNNSVKDERVNIDEDKHTDSDQLIDSANKHRRRGDSFSSSEDETSYTNKDNLGNILPDFLSEVSRHKTKPVKNKLDIHVQGLSDQNHVNDCINNDLSELREENLRLKEQLEVLEIRKKADMQRINELEKQVEEQRKKEVEETSIMEKAMEQVEENLKITTKRAVNAEGTISKLKLEIKSLQAELKMYQNGNEQGKPDRLSDVKERTSYVAEQLASATKTAETSLRQLLSGVDKLKVLSQVLDSVDKITEQKTTDEIPGEST